MKRFIQFTLGWLFITGLWYLSWAFIFMDVNAFHWTETARIGLIITIIGSTFLYSMAFISIVIDL